MTQGLGKPQIQQREEKKQIIQKFIQNNPTTYVNAIVEALRMSKTTVVACVQELLESKRIISLKDSHNPEFTPLWESNKKKKRNQLVYYYSTEEQTKIFHKEETISVLPKPRKNDEITRYFDMVITYLKEIRKFDRELLKKYNESNESEKAILDRSITKEMVSEQIELHATLSLARENLDSRIKRSKYEKIMMAYYMNTDYSINRMSKRSGYSTKYCSQLSKNVLSVIGLSTLGDFNFKKTDPAFPKLREILGQCPHCNVWTVDALCENTESKE